MWFVLTTWLTDRFDLAVPVVSAPMAGASGGALAAAVSSAGALGMLGIAATTPDELRRELALASASQRPFGVGFLAAGAAGAWVGSAFVACAESAWPPPSKDAVVAAGLTDTLYSTVYDIGRRIPWPEEFGGRALRNDYATRWHGREAELAADPQP